VLRLYWCGRLGHRILVNLSATSLHFDGVDIPEIIHVRVARPDLVLSLREISVQPNEFTTPAVYLNTKLCLGTYITATSSDPTRVTINGPLLVYKPRY